jgi:hypothetical protein
MGSPTMGRCRSCHRHPPSAKHQENVASPTRIVVVGAGHDGLIAAVRVGSHRDLQILLDRAPGIGEESPLCSYSVAELVRLQDVVGGDGDDLGVSNGDPGIEGRELQMLLVVLGTVVPPARGSGSSDPDPGAWRAGAGCGYGRSIHSPGTGRRESCQHAYDPPSLRSTSLSAVTVSVLCAAHSAVSSRHATRTMSLRAKMGPTPSPNR